MIATGTPTPRRPLLMIMAGGLSSLVLAPPAYAAGGVALSLDGEHWGSTVDTPLWDPAVRWVPGDSRRVSVWVRNDTGIASALLIEAVTASRTATSALADRLTATARVDGVATEVDDDLVPVSAAPPYRQRRVDLTLSLPAAAGNDTQALVSATRVRITLRERTDGPGVRPGPLPGTGGVAIPPIAAGAGALLVGAGLLRCRRRTAGGSP